MLSDIFNEAELEILHYYDLGIYEELLPRIDKILSEMIKLRMELDVFDQDELQDNPFYVSVCDGNIKEYRRLNREWDGDPRTVGELVYKRDAN